MINKPFILSIPTSTVLPNRRHHIIVTIIKTICVRRFVVCLALQLQIQYRTRTIHPNIHFIASSSSVMSKSQVEDMLDDIQYILECIVYNIFTVSTLVYVLFLGSTIYMKRYWLRPYIEKRLKTHQKHQNNTSLVQRWQSIRNRQLNDFLQDPILVEHLQQQLLRQHNMNDINQVQAMIDGLRSQVVLVSSSSSSSSLSSSTEGGLSSFSSTLSINNDNNDNDDGGNITLQRGEEKMFTLKLIYYGTMISSIVFLVTYNIVRSSRYLGPSSSRSSSSWHYYQSSSIDEVTNEQVNVNLFLLLHVIDSWFLLYNNKNNKSHGNTYERKQRRQQQQKKKRTSSSSSSSSISCLCCSCCNSSSNHTSTEEDDNDDENDDDMNITSSHDDDENDNDNIKVPLLKTSAEEAGAGEEMVL